MGKVTVCLIRKTLFVFEWFAFYRNFKLPWDWPVQSLVKYSLDNIQNAAITEISFTQTKHLGIGVPETTEEYKR